MLRGDFGEASGVVCLFAKVNSGKSAVVSLLGDKLLEASGVVRLLGGGTRTQFCSNLPA